MIENIIAYLNEFKNTCKTSLVPDKNHEHYLKGVMFAIKCIKNRCMVEKSKRDGVRLDRSKLEDIFKCENIGDEE